MMAKPVWNLIFRITVKFDADDFKLAVAAILQLTAFGNSILVDLWYAILHTKVPETVEKPF